jgi:sporadic carbohydrate cluster 2OG-Fe(II) oxygenase
MARRERRTFARYQSSRYLIVILLTKTGYVISYRVTPGFCSGPQLRGRLLRGSSPVSLSESFFSDDETTLADEFHKQGYIIRDVEDRSALDALRGEIALAAARLLEQPAPKDAGAFLDGLHRIITIDKINSFRLGVYRELNTRAWFRPTYFRLGRHLIEALVGNELAMQNRINFSIQMPEDRTSLLDIHADVFSGETPFQVVQWLPLVDVARTKSMFYLPRPKSEAVKAHLKDFAGGGMKALFDAVKSDLIWLTVPYGKLVIFSPNCLHGNVLNEEPTTRWSLNTRFTGLFTPYNSGEKMLGSFYLPITVRPVTRVGLAYRHPEGFEE